MTNLRKRNPFLLRQFMQRTDLTLLLTSAIFCHALVLKAEVKDHSFQQKSKIVYKYDASGNRILRTVTSNSTCDSTSIDIGDIVVTPTITTDGVTISTTVDLNKSHLNYELSNLTGNCVAEGVIVDQVSRLNMPSTNGIYILNVRLKKNSKSFKIVKK